MVPTQPGLAGKGPVETSDGVFCLYLTVASLSDGFLRKWPRQLLADQAWACFVHQKSRNSTEIHNVGDDHRPRLTEHSVTHPFNGSRSVEKGAGLCFPRDKTNPNRVI